MKKVFKSTCVLVLLLLASALLLPGNVLAQDPDESEGFDRKFNREVTIIELPDTSQVVIVELDCDSPGSDCMSIVITPN